MLDPGLLSHFIPEPQGANCGRIAYALIGAPPLLLRNTVHAS